MRWHKELYHSASIKQVKWTKYQIVHGKKSKGYYCIALAGCPGNLLDIYESKFLRTTKLNLDDLYVIGIAKSKAEAYEVVREIIEDVYTHTKGFDIRQYLNITV